jgi:small neutral amino acid transporter SnatA (MarC family)
VTAKVREKLILHRQLCLALDPPFVKASVDANPIENVALFAGLTAALGRAERHRTALRPVIYATITLVGAATVGQVILDAIGIHMHSLKVAGGIILFLFGVQMLLLIRKLLLCQSPQQF